MEKIINVTVPNLPNINEYIEYIRGIWDRNHLTNQELRACFRASKKT